MLSVVGRAGVGQSAMEQRFDGVIDAPNDAKTTLWVETTVDVEHAGLAVDPVAKRGVAALSLQGGDSFVGVKARDLAFYRARKVVGGGVCCNGVEPFAALREQLAFVGVEMMRGARQCVDVRGGDVAVVERLL